MRGFFGGGGKGTGKGTSKMGFAGRGGSTTKGKEEMMEKLLAAKSGKGVAAKTVKVDYAQVMREKLDAKKAEMLRASAESKSANFKKAVEQMIVNAEKKAAKQMKKRQQVEIKSRTFGGYGHMDGNGKIFNSKGELVMTVDKTGMMKTAGGMRVGKYDSSDPNLGNKMSILIERHSKKAPTGGSTVWGNTSSDGGSWWGGGGGGGGSWWGNNDDDKGGGW